MSSSGRRAKRPAQTFALMFEVKALPDGLIPRGCLLTSVASPFSRSRLPLDPEPVLILFEGLPWFKSSVTACPLASAGWPTASSEGLIVPVPRLVGL